MNTAVLVLLLAAGGMPGCAYLPSEDDGAPGPTEPDGSADAAEIGTEEPEPEGNIDEEPMLYPNALLDGTRPEYGCGETGPHVYHDRPCTDHSQCTDGLFCNGEERCGRFGDETLCYAPCGCPPCNPCYDWPDEVGECYSGICLEEQGACVYRSKDLDGDGYADADCEGGDDCNDQDPGTHPGAPDICDGLDNNCNGAADEDGWSAAWDGDPVMPGREEAAVTDYDITPMGDAWQAAWLEEGSVLRFAEIAGDGSVEGGTDPLHTAAENRTAGDLSVIGREGACFVVWVEQGADGSEILVMRHDAGPGASPEVVLASGEIIENLVARTRPGSDRSAGLFFKMGSGGESADLEIFYLPLSDYGASPPEHLDGSGPRRITECRGFSGHPDASPVSGGDEWMLTWDDSRDGDRQIYVMKIGFEDRRPSDLPIKLTTSPGDSEQPAIACLETEGKCTIAWMDERSGPFTVFAVTVDLEGRPMARETGCSSPPLSSWNAAVAADGDRGQFFIAFTAASGPGTGDIRVDVAGGDTATAVPAVVLEGRDGGAAFMHPKSAMSRTGKLAVAWLDAGSETGAALNVMAFACTGAP